MNNLFNYDNKFVSSVTKAVDALWLGFLWMLCSLPVITVSAASAAFYYAFLKSIRQGSGYPTREFFHSFKTNFKQAIILWLLLLFLALILSLDLFILTSGALNIGLLSSFLVTTSVAIFAIQAMWGLCAFPYLSRFENTFKGMLNNSLIITLANLHWALLLLALFILGIVAFLTVPLLNLFVPAIYMFVANRILERVFRKYMRPEDLEAQKEAEALN